MSPLEGSRRRNPAVPTPRYFPDPIKKDRLLCGLGRNPGWDRSHQRARGNRRLRSARHASPWYFSDPIKKGGPDDSLGWFGGLFRRLPEGPSPAAPEIEYGHSIQHTRAARMRGTAAPHHASVISSAIPCADGRMPTVAGITNLLGMLGLRHCTLWEMHMSGKPTDGGGECARKRRRIPPPDADPERTRRDGAHRTGFGPTTRHPSVTDPGSRFQQCRKVDLRGPQRGIPFTLTRR
jgi:hypothetical protein